tara:strand:+ start:4718 stop:5380 length:663 start_codon:yes stop_codon:yes gene_type:complete
MSDNTIFALGALGALGAGAVMSFFISSVIIPSNNTQDDEDDEDDYDEDDEEVPGETAEEREARLKKKKEERDAKRKKAAEDRRAADPCYEENIFRNANETASKCKQLPLTLGWVPPRIPEEKVKLIDSGNGATLETCIKAARARELPVTVFVTNDDPVAADRGSCFGYENFAGRHVTPLALTDDQPATASHFMACSRNSKISALDDKCETDMQGAVNKMF